MFFCDSPVRYNSRDQYNMTRSGKPHKSYQRVRLGMLIVSTVGIVLAVYALYVETAKEHDGNYKAMCDISSSVSCSKVFTSKYGRGFGLVGSILGEDHFLNVPNSIPGIIFYILNIIMGEVKSIGVARAQRVILSLSNLMSLYLGYLLYFVLHDFCVVCVSTYMVNLILTVLSFYRVSALQAITTGKVKLK
ncbi:hypothetical protein Pmani_037263 [Petrolisthes manimaculis]|uniref:vitamin-K-epoxide reductase (warfarin-sensitive) n=1 Tax=Petrolisthes manimaculis TaxID=1843537 RepID=A0AAE1NIK1_9EUCA|nr:hypothetical protein Pmani_037263 [Petrolisthes manimaculis]